MNEPEPLVWQQKSIPERAPPDREGTLQCVFHSREVWQRRPSMPKPLDPAWGAEQERTCPPEEETDTNREKENGSWS